MFVTELSSFDSVIPNTAGYNFALIYLLGATVIFAVGSVYSELTIRFKYSIIFSKLTFIFY